MTTLYMPDERAMRGRARGIFVGILLVAGETESDRIRNQRQNKNLLEAMKKRRRKPLSKTMQCELAVSHQVWYRNIYRNVF